MKSSPSRMVAWIVWVIASVFYAYQYILRVMPNIMLEDIMQQFQFDAATFGQFSGIYYIGYSLMHIPIGLMLDRVGPKKVMTGAILFTVMGLMPLIFSDYWVYPILGRLCIGMGSSAAILGVFKIIRMTFNEKLFPRMLSFSVMIGLVGAIYGGGPVSYMTDLFGYQAVTKGFAIGGVLLAIATYFIIPKMEKSQETTLVSDVMEVLGNSRVILSCLFAGLMVGPLEGFADVWGTAFLKHVYGFEGTIAASLPSMIFIGMCFGAPVLSFLAEKAGSYLGTVVASGIAMAAGFFLLLGLELNPSILSISFVIVGICSAYQILAIYNASTYVRAEVSGLTSAVANMIIMIFGYIFHSVIGGVVNAMGGATNANALSFGVAVIPIALVIGTTGFIALMVQDRLQHARKVL